MMEQISSQVQDDGIKNAEGKPFAGGQLFRKYLLNSVKRISTAPLSLMSTFQILGFEEILL
jgi:hypothetical protein